MDTHERQVNTRLYPSEHTLYVRLIGILVAGAEESSRIVCPPRQTCRLHTQSRRDLSAQRLPVIAHITRPHGRAIALDAGETTARENHRSGARLVMAQSLVYRFVDQQRIHISHMFSSPSSVVDTSSHEVIVLRLRGILPPSVNAQRQQPLREIAPIGLCRLVGEEVHPVGTVDVMAILRHEMSHLRVAVNLRPYTHHETFAHVVQTVGHHLGIRIALFIETHGVPPVFAPVLPVLYEHVDRYRFLLEPLRRGKDFLL